MRLLSIIKKHFFFIFILLLINNKSIAQKWAIGQKQDTIVTIDLKTGLLVSGLVTINKEGNPTVTDSDVKHKPNRNGFLPFDIPFILRVKTDTNVEDLELKILESRFVKRKTYHECYDSLESVHTPKWPYKKYYNNHKAQANINKMYKYVQSIPFTPTGMEEHGNQKSFYLSIPPLEANRRYTFAFTKFNKKTLTETSAKKAVSSEIYKSIINSKERGETINLDSKSTTEIKKELERLASLPVSTEINKNLNSALTEIKSSAKQLSDKEKISVSNITKLLSSYKKKISSDTFFQKTIIKEKTIIEDIKKIRNEYVTEFKRSQLDTVAFQAIQNYFSLEGCMLWFSPL